ncbi:multidrug effflux MFS transporter [Flavobacterium sp. '19STA2R22 D10 B1']|uniref:multidrug effflux MFS transporter n=1 Tax=Flavobacterium aerium TaxID=3037261 RepID=UPI00278BB394|nr:multidrug effflux MFS transporter [Flavobacterium sp. '19STA2R22 D10 B1']
MSIKQKYTILFILGGLSALAPFSIDMYLPAFPSISKSLNTDISQVGLSLTAYFIGISIGQLFYGPITDKYGRKKPLLFGLSIFLLASIGCALSPSINWLIGMRVVLALGGCVGMVVSRAIVRDLFPVTEIAKIFSILMLIVGVAPVLAPTIGGWVLSVSTWRTIFYFLTGFSLLLIAAVYFFLPESKQPDTSKSLSFQNVLQEYKTVLEDKSFLFYALAGGIAMAGMFAYISGSPFVFMKYFNSTETEYSWIFGANACGLIIGSQINRLLLMKWNTVQVAATVSVLLCCIALILLSLYHLEMLDKKILIVLLFCFLLCLGMFVPNATALALAPFTKNAGSASALLGFLQMLCSATISGLVSFLHDETMFPMVFCMFLCGAISFMTISFFHLRQKVLKFQNI